MTAHLGNDPPAPRRVVQRRGISHTERALVRWLLEHAATVEIPATWLDAVPHLQVVDACPCGCPSVDFVTDGQSVARIVADASGESPSGDSVGVLLWAKDGQLSGLEVYSVDGNDNRQLPNPLALRATFEGAG